MDSRSKGFKPNLVSRLWQIGHHVLPLAARTRNFYSLVAGRPPSRYDWAMPTPRCFPPPLWRFQPKRDCGHRTPNPVPGTVIGGRRRSLGCDNYAETDFFRCKRRGRLVRGRRMARRHYRKGQNIQGRACGFGLAELAISCLAGMARHRFRRRKLLSRLPLAILPTSATITRPSILPSVPRKILKEIPRPPNSASRDD
jgi:hypothetical protein